MPKLIHRFWTGCGMPEKYRAFGTQWAELNPDWDVIDWSAETLPPLINQELYDSLGLTGAVAPIPVSPQVALATQRADIVGYELVHRYGGVYVNCDMQPLRPFDGHDDFLNLSWAAYEHPGYLNNGAIGAPEPNSVFWRAVIDRLPVRYTEMPGEPFQRTTGPWLLTEVFDSQDWSDVFQPVDTRLWHHAHFSQVEIGGDASHLVDEARAVGAIALHHWGHRHDQVNW